MINDLFRKSFQHSTVDTRQRLTSRQTKQRDDSLHCILDQSGVEKWINEILKETSLNDKLNGLSKLGLDRSSLKSAGVKDEDVSRLYRSLFVYTVGFYEMLHDILKNHSLTAAIWRVFGILLEYTAQADFQFTINQIQQESQQRIEELNETLTLREKKLKYIENKTQEEIEQLNHLIRETQNQNLMLKQQRENAETDFQLQNNAFEEEVALRIKFEYRINEFTSIYRQLEQNFQIVCDELNEIRQLYDKISNDLTKTKQQLEQKIEENDRKENEIQNLKLQIDNYSKAITDKQYKLQLQDLRIEKLNKMSVNTHSISMNYEHQYNQLCMQFSKYKEENILNLQELEKYQRNYAELQGKFNELSEDYQQKKDLLFSLQTENNKQKISIDSFEQLEQGYRQSIMQIQQENRELMEEYEKKIRQYQKIEVEHSFAQQRISVQMNEILALNQNIQQMKLAKIHLDELFIKEKSKVQLLENNLEAKEETIQDLEKCLSFSQQRLHTLNIEMNDLENKLRTVQQDNIISEMALKKQNEQLQDMIDNQRQELINERDKFEGLSNQFESQRKELADIKSLYKVQVFENNNLVTKQIFSDRIINNDNQRIGEFINEITDTKVKYDESQRKYRQLEIKYNEQERLIERERLYLIDRYDNKISHYKFMQKEMVSKMKLEDALSQWDRINQKYLGLLKIASDLEEENKILKIEKIQSTDIIQNQNKKLIEQIQQLDKLQKENKNIKDKFKLKSFKFLMVSASKHLLKLENQEFSQLIQSFKTTNSDLQEQISQLSQENQKQKLLIRRYRLSVQGLQNQQNISENQSINNDLNTEKNIDPQQIAENSNVIKDQSKSEKSQDESNNSMANSLVQSQQKQAKRSKFQIDLELVQQKLKETQLERSIKLEQLSQTAEIKQFLKESNKEIITKKQDSIQIKEDLLNMTGVEFQIERDTQQQVESIKSRSVSISQGSKSQRSNKSQGQMDFIVRAKRNNVISNSKMTSKQFGKLFQITRDHYQS